MARKKAPNILQGRAGQSIVDRLERAVSTVANAASVAATGSELGVLELAVEDDLGMRKPKTRARKTARKAKTAKKAKKQAKTKAKKPTIKKPAIKRRKTAAKRLRKPARRAAKTRGVAKRRSR